MFVCLLSEIRALSFLINLPNSPYIQERLHARLERPNYHTVEELESYLHPAFRPALDRIFDTYEKFYMDAAGLEIIEKLREQVYGNIAQRVMPRSVPDVSRLWRSIRNESLPVSRNMDDLLDRTEPSVPEPSVPDFITSGASKATGGGCEPVDSLPVTPRVDKFQPVPSSTI